MSSRKPDLHLLELLCHEAVVLAEKTLRSRCPGSAQPVPGLALATVPTPEVASVDERHELGLRAIDTLDTLLGHDAVHSVSHTRATSIAIGCVARHLAI